MQPLGPFAASRRIAVAVSGGADSMALAHLAERWGTASALIVDHGLRPESAAEAELTRARLPMPARVLRLAGLEPGPALHERARVARYAALVAACAELGVVDLLLGHHQADQAETCAMRAEAGSGAAGLAGMAALVTLPSVRLLRPLLGVAPERLRATLAAAGLAWIEDPSNRNPATWRGRMRGRTLPTVASDAGRNRAAAEKTLVVTLAAEMSMRPEGFAVIADQALDAPVLRAACWTVSGRPYPPATAAIARLAASPREATLHGVMLRRHRHGWLVVREAAAMAPAVAAVPGARWDGRFELLRAAQPPEHASLGALGPAAPRFAGRGIPASVLRAMPALWASNGLLAVPHLDYPSADECRHVPIAFAPSHPAGGAAFVPASEGVGDAQVTRTTYVCSTLGARATVSGDKVA